MHGTSRGVCAQRGTRQWAHAALKRSVVAVALLGSTVSLFACSATDLTRPELSHTEMPSLSPRFSGVWLRACGFVVVLRLQVETRPAWRFALA